MNLLTRSALASVLLVVLLVLPSPDGASTSAVAALGTGLNLDSETAQGAKMVESLGIHEALGPLAPIALSPFFALTCLSGVSILADYGLVPDFLAGVANNPIVGTSSLLNNGLVFCALLALSVITAVPKLTKLTKPFAQAIDQIEAHAGIISIVAVQFLSQMNFGDAADPEKVAVIYQAGIISFTSTTLIAVFSAINVFVVNTVKFFFETMILLSPFPLVDAAFEAANKAVVGILISVYVFSPFWAMVVNLVIFGLSLLIFAWAYRRAVYMKCLLGDPVLGWIAEAIFRRKPATVISTRLPASISRQLRDPKLVLKAFSDRSFQGLKTKTGGFLVAAGEEVLFATPRFLRSPLIVKMPQAGHQRIVDKGFISNSVRFENDTGDAAMKVLFTRRYNDVLVDIESVLSASGGSIDEKLDTKSVMSASRSIGAAVKGEGRAAIRAELA